MQHIILTTQLVTSDSAIRELTNCNVTDSHGTFVIVLPLIMGFQLGTCFKPWKKLSKQLNRLFSCSYFDVNKRISVLWVCFRWQSVVLIVNESEAKHNRASGFYRVVYIHGTFGSKFLLRGSRDLQIYRNSELYTPLRFVITVFFVCDACYRLHSSIIGNQSGYSLAVTSKWSSLCCLRMTILTWTALNRIFLPYCSVPMPF